MNDGVVLGLRKKKIVRRPWFAIYVRTLVLTFPPCRFHSEMQYCAFQTENHECCARTSNTTLENKCKNHDCILHFSIISFLVKTSMDIVQSGLVRLFLLVKTGMGIVPLARQVTENISGNIFRIPGIVRPSYERLLLFFDCLACENLVWRKLEVSHLKRT